MFEIMPSRTAELFRGQELDAEAEQVLEDYEAHSQ